MKPMLAKRYNDQRKHTRFPCLVQPKLNGVRALYIDGRLQSRDQKFWHENILIHITDAIRRHLPPSIIFDGEIYVHGWPLQRINGAAAVNRITPRPDTRSVHFFIFDYYDPLQPLLSNIHRIEQLSAWFASSEIPPPLFLTPTYICDSHETLTQHFHTFNRLRYEGLMYRALSAPYGHELSCTNKENRWPTLLKLKDWFDDWFPVIDYELGKGKYEGALGALICELPDTQTFSVGTGFTDLERTQFLTRLPSSVHVRYEMLSDTGIPLKPTAIETRYESI